ncbi:PEP-CTERM sorting domain-containing protein [Verrucomicrobiales bacterium]|nr:PEP-CTERM sorting domain-containing protein [Verrucomicrobiales bacterium]
MKLISSSIFSISLMVASMAPAALIVDFTSSGPDGTVLGGPFTFASEDPTGTGVQFMVTASAVIPGGGGANMGDISRLNAGLGSTVENTGGFLNVIGGVSEVLRFTVSSVTGLQAGQSLQLSALLSQNSRSTNADQTGGFGGTFGQQAADSVTLTSDNASTIVINQSDNDLGSILLNADGLVANGNNANNTGNTFSHAGTLDFTDSFDVALTDLNANEAITIQGFEFAVVPEPSTSLLALGGLGLLLVRKRRA